MDLFPCSPPRRPLTIPWLTTMRLAVLVSSVCSNHMTVNLSAMLALRGEAAYYWENKLMATVQFRSSRYSTHTRLKRRTPRATVCPPGRTCADRLVRLFHPAAAPGHLVQR